MYVIVVVDGCCKEMLVSSVSLVFALLIKAVLGITDSQMCMPLMDF